MCYKAQLETDCVSKSFFMNPEMQFIISQLKDTYEGDPWFGRAAVKLLSEVNEKTAYQKPAGHHSILELLWHMITWREFTIDRLKDTPQMKMDYFENMDWRELDHNDMTLWKEGLEHLRETQDQLLSLLSASEDVLLEKLVDERTYNFRKLLHGLIQHDIYHLGQIAYIQ
jgi:uncharacterized damage-inducible protein DinB